METALPLETSLSQTHLEDLKLAASSLSGAKRRAFQARISQKYCAGNARKTEYLFGWGRHPVTLGLHEKRTGLVCFGAQSAASGNQRWEDKHPDVAAALWERAEAYSQPSPDLPYLTGLCPPDLGGSVTAIATAGFSGGTFAQCQFHGEHFKPQRLPAASGTES